MEVVAVNDLTDNRTLATLLKYDSTHRRYPGKVEYTETHLIVDGRKIVIITKDDQGKPDLAKSALAKQPQIPQPPSRPAG